MRATAVFDDRECLANATARLEELQQHHRIGQVTEVDAALVATERTVLRVEEKGQHALLIQVRKQLVHPQHELFFLRHRR